MATQRKALLQGIKVLDFTRAVAGAYCTRLLCDMGAEVIKIEAPEIGDTVRFVGPLDGPSWTTPPSMGPMFVHCNAGKKSLCIDLKKPEAVDLIKRLVPQMDVVVENFTPHVMPGYGLAYEDLRRLRGDIVMCSITGFGQEGPLANNLATDPVAQAMGGMAYLCGEENNGYPYLAGNGIADTVTATTAAMAILGALLHRARTGEGQYIDISMMDTVFAVDAAAAPYFVASRGHYTMQRGGRFHHLQCPWGVFRGPQGRYFVIMAGWDMAWQRLAQLMGRPDLIDDPEFATNEARLRNREKVHQIIEEFLQGFETDEAAYNALAEARLAAGMVLDPWEVATHPQVTQRNMVREIPYPFGSTVPTIATAPHFSETPITVGRAPFAGEHNRPVLRDLLHLSEEEIERLHADGVLYEDVAVKHLDDAT